MSVHKKIMQARISLQNSKLTKSGNNKFAGYKYFELGDFLPAAQRILAELGLCGIVSFGAEEATLTITDTEDNSQLVITSPMSTAALKGCHAVQNLGAVQTYIRRYLWVAALEIVEHDAIDMTTGKAEPEPEQEKPAVHIERIVESITNSADLNTLQSHFKAAWLILDKSQRAPVKAAYDQRKAELGSTKEVAA